MGILLIILTIINVLFLLFSICLFFTPYYYFSIAIIVIVMNIYLLVSIMFFKYTNRQLELEKDTLIALKITKIMNEKNEINYIEFEFKNNKWICVKDKNIQFKLDNYLFKKSFIIARIIRELRYPIISNKLNLSKLLSYKLKITNIDNLCLRFINGNKINNYIIVKNGVSKNTILSGIISKSKYYSYYFSNEIYNRYLKKIEKINENIYLNQ